MRAALYARLSREDANAGIKIPEQLKLCRDHAKVQGWQIVLEDWDDGISGTVEDRPGLRRILTAASRREFSILVARDQDRLARGDDLVGWVRHELARHGVQIVTLLELGVSPIERGVRTIIGAEYVRRTRQLITARMRGKAALGEFTGGRAPLGYVWSVTVSPIEEAQLRLARRTVPRHLEIRLPEVDLIQRLFSMLDPNGEYRSLRATARTLDWPLQVTVRRARNPIYAGGYSYGKKAGIEGKKNQYRRRPRAEWLVIWDHHEPIISRDQWERVQERLDGLAAGWRGIRGPASARLALTGLLRCGECDGLMAVSGAGNVRKDGSRTYYYACRASRLGESDCPGVGSVSTAGWVASLLAEMAEQHASPHFASQLRADLVSAYRAGRQRGHLEAEIRRNERAVESILAVLRSGEVRDTLALARSLDATQAALKLAREQIAVHRQSDTIPTQKQLSRLLCAIATDLQDMGAALPSEIESAARPLLHRIARCITVSRDGPAQVEINSALPLSHLQGRHYLIAWIPPGRAA